MFDDGQRQMGIKVRITVPREVFSAGGNVFLQPFGECEGFFNYRVRGIAKTSVTNDGIIRIGINVKNRGKIKIKPKFGERLAEAPGEFQGESGVGAVEFFFASSSPSAPSPLRRIARRTFWRSNKYILQNRS